MQNKTNLKSVKSLGESQTNSQIVKTTLMNKIDKDFETSIIKVKKDMAATISQQFYNFKEKERGFTQKTFAKLLKCSQPRVSNIITSNVDDFTIDKLYEFCIHLGINPLIQTKPLKNIKSDTRELLDVITQEEGLSKSKKSKK